MAMMPRDELSDELLARLHDPAKYVERMAGDRKDRQEPLKMWQLRALMTYFEDVQYKEVNGKKVVLARSAFRDKNPDLDDE